MRINGTDYYASPNRSLHPNNGHRMPRTAARRLHLASVEFGGNAAHRKSILLQLTNDGGELLGTGLRLGAIFRCEYLGAGLPELHAARLGNRQARLGAR